MTCGFHRLLRWKQLAFVLWLLAIGYWLFAALFEAGGFDRFY
jgi:hypothetical protein